MRVLYVSFNDAFIIIVLYWMWLLLLYLFIIVLFYYCIYYYCIALFVAFITVSIIIVLHCTVSILHSYFYYWLAVCRFYPWVLFLYLSLYCSVVIFYCHFHYCTVNVSLWAATCLIPEFLVFFFPFFLRISNGQKIPLSTTPLLLQQKIEQWSKRGSISVSIQVSS